MNEAQILHVQAMIRKIKLHAASILTRVQGIEQGHLNEYPLEAINAQFSDINHYCGEIKSVIADMLPHMPANGLVRCPSCERIVRKDQLLNNEPDGVCELCANDSIE